MQCWEEEKLPPSPALAVPSPQHPVASCPFPFHALVVESWASARVVLRRESYRLVGVAPRISFVAFGLGDSRGVDGRRETVGRAEAVGRGSLDRPSEGERRRLGGALGG